MCFMFKFLFTSMLHEHEKGHIEMDMDRGTQMETDMDTDIDTEMDMYIQRFRSRTLHALFCQIYKVQNQAQTGIILQ